MTYRHLLLVLVAGLMAAPLAAYDAPLGQAQLGGPADLVLDGQALRHDAGTAVLTPGAELRTGLHGASIVLANGDTVVVPSTTRLAFAGDRATPVVRLVEGELAFYRAAGSTTALHVGEFTIEADTEVTGQLRNIGDGIVTARAHEAPFALVGPDGIRASIEAGDTRTLALATDMRGRRVVLVQDDPMATDTPDPVGDEQVKEDEDDDAAFWLSGGSSESPMFLGVPVTYTTAGLGILAAGAVVGGGAIIANNVDDDDDDTDPSPVRRIPASPVTQPIEQPPIEQPPIEQPPIEVRF